MFSVTAGVNKLQLPMTTGQITVSMVRGGQTIISKTDTNFNIIGNPTQCKARVLWQLNLLMGLGVNRQLQCLCWFCE